MDGSSVSAAVETMHRMMSSAIRHQTPCGDGHMVWHEWGDKEQTPLVLLHGGSGSWTHWIRNIPTLMQHFRVISADTPGLGDSDMPPELFTSKDYPAGMRMLAQVFADGLDQIIGPSVRFHLAGFSMGSIAGAYVAANQGARVMSLTLAGSSAFGLHWGGLKQTLGAMREGMSDAERLEVQRRNLKIIMTHAEADDFAGHLQLLNVERARIRSHGLPHTDTLLQALPLVTAPVNGIWGREDVYAQGNLQTIETLLRQNTSALNFKVIDDAGHWVMYEQSDAFNAALIAMIEAQE
jgi:2-hydroxy-6-oxonona-2,4-dienedioate hydrolase